MITITNKNKRRLQLSSSDFETNEKYQDYLKTKKRFENNQKYFFEFECIICKFEVITYHYILKCPNCEQKFTMDENFIKDEKDWLSGYWDPKIVKRRHDLVKARKRR